MLWGITEESISQWLSMGRGDDANVLTGMAASPGVAEGPARVIFGPAEIGGIMSHAAIGCREYGLPAVTGTAVGTKRISTGQRIRVDGDTGRVIILD